MKSLTIASALAVAILSLPSVSSATLQPRTVFAEEFGWVH
jgi:hypothetical protein